MRALRLTAVVVLIIAIACGDPYLHLNPYDPDTPVEMDVTGPDTIFSLGDIVQYAVKIVPAFPDTGVRWAADTITIFQGDSSYVLDGSSFLTAAEDGNFQAINLPLEPGTIPISVEALIGQIDTVVSRNEVTIRTFQYRHSGFKRVILMQRLTRIQLRCPDTHTCAPFSVGATGTVFVDGFDALGHQIAALTSATLNPDTGFVIANYLSRDPTVASVAPKGIRGATVTAATAGTTWIVATRKLLFDSLQVVVH